MNTFLEALLNGWWQGILLTLLVWLVLRDLPRISAATRLALWHTTLLVVLLLPALQRIPLPHWGPAAAIPPAVTAAAPAQQNTAPVQARDLPAPTPTSPTPVMELHEDPVEVLLFLCVAMALLKLLRLAIGYWAVRRLKRKGRRVDVTLPMAMARSIDVILSDDIGMPMAVGYFRPAILLPRGMADRLTAEELRYVLLHESAHLRRNDDWMALIERIVRAIFFFQPAVYWISRQIEKEREMACDDWVIAEAGETKPYANSLARLADLASQGRVPVLATGAGKRKQIFARLETMLDRTRNCVPSVSEPLVIVAGIALWFVVAQGSAFNHLLGLSKYSSRWVESDGVQKREIKMRGDVEFTANDRDVEKMSPGGKLVVETSQGWLVRRVEFDADDQGNIKRSYFSNGTARPFDAEARRFLDSALPQWIRERGDNIPERLSRMTQEKGVDAALEDVRTIRGGHVKRAYLEELFVQAQLNVGQMRRVLKIGSGIDSDDEKRKFLENVHGRLAGRGVDAQVLGFIDSIHSDRDRRQLLLNALNLRLIAEQESPRLFQTAGRINSDGDKTAVMLQAVQLAKTRLPAEFFEAASTIHSDGERERLLSLTLTVHSGDTETVARALRASASMASDEHKAKVMVVAARGVRSNHETMREVVSQALTIASDREKSHVLLSVAARFAQQEPLRHDFFSALNTIHSSADQRSVLMAILERPDADRETLLEVSRSASAMTSKEDQSAVLKRLADRR
ncbi:MAG: M56 family metallopeptidase [Candidatus Solibacter usitatus]|nr:M56 family metallopeptidase [Candidatus Solibacter usitatus]